jgi:hypothetical protein
MNDDMQRRVIELQTETINMLRAKLDERQIAWLHVWDGGHSVHATEQEARDEIANAFREVGLPPGHLSEPSYLCAVVGVARQVSSIVWEHQL